jgi:membrane fusion protein (multidrug efflux system)
MSTEPRPPASRWKLGIFGVVALAGALTLVVSGIRAREDTSVKLKEWTEDQSVPSVAVIYADPGALTQTIDLPGRLEAYYRAPIFARVNG